MSYLFSLLSGFTGLLTVVAILPGVFLLKKISSMDRLEKESSTMMKKLVLAGIISAFIAIVEEVIGELIIVFLIPRGIIQQFIEYFFVVALAEESSKYLMMKKNTWNSEEFNCLYDGIVYASYVSLGFAIYENIKYVRAYGLFNGIFRAFTAVPAHASFGVFMGVYYAAAKKHEYLGMNDEMRKYKFLSVFVPVMLHGTYDFVVSLGTWWSFILFFVFITIMFLFARYVAKKNSQNDEYIRLFDMRQKD